MVDSGSNKSLIRKEFADKLGLVGETKKMKMYVAGGGIRVEDSAEFDLKISPCYDEDIVFNVRAYSFSQETMPSSQNYFKESGSQISSPCSNWTFYWEQIYRKPIVILKFWRVTLVNRLQRRTSLVGQSLVILKRIVHLEFLLSKPLTT
jgi:hypothetical protein